MSRVARMPVSLPQGVTTTIAGDTVTVKGAKGTISLPLRPGLTLVQEASSVRVEPAETQPRVADARGLAAFAPRERRARRVEGLREEARAGRRRLPRAGAGQQPQPDARLLAPGRVRGTGGDHDRDAVADGNRREGRGQAAVGQVAAEIRAYRSPEPYKGKGVRYSGERIELKETKKK